MRTQQEGVTLILSLNPLKCEFSKNQIKFLRHNVDKDGDGGDPAKTQAIVGLPLPSNVKEMYQFVGMINQLAKFIPNCANIICPLTELLSTK